MALTAIIVRMTGQFAHWLEELRDQAGRAVIARRVKRLSQGNAGDVKGVGAGISELRIHYGPGYGVYFIRRNSELILLLCGGDKSSQERDIALAKSSRTRETETMSLLKQFDPLDYLKDQASIAAYLSDALENEDARGVVDALGDVVRARGGADRLAQETSISEDTISLALNESAPNLDAMLQLLHVLGVRLSASLVA